MWDEPSRRARDSAQQCRNDRRGGGVDRRRLSVGGPAVSWRAPARHDNGPRRRLREHIRGHRRASARPARPCGADRRGADRHWCTQSHGAHLDGRDGSPTISSAEHDRHLPRQHGPIESCARCRSRVTDDSTDSTRPGTVDDRNDRSSRNVRNAAGHIGTSGTSTTATTAAPRPEGVPADWPANKPIPPVPADCVQPQLEDNGIWNCQR